MIESREGEKVTHRASCVERYKTVDDIVTWTSELA